MESLPIQTTDNGECISPSTSWSLSNNHQIPFLTPSPSSIRYIPPTPAGNCMIRHVFTPSQYPQYGPLHSETAQSIPNPNNVNNWIPSLAPMFPPPPYPPPGINYKIPEESATCLNSFIDRRIPPKEFFNSTKWLHATPSYPVPRLPRCVINNGEWIDSSRSVNSNWPQTPLSPPTSPFECNSFMPASNNTNDCTPPHIPCFETSCYDQPPYPLSNVSDIPVKCCNEDCASGSSSSFIAEQSFLPGHHSSNSFNPTSANLPEQSMYSVPIPSPLQYYPPIPTYSRLDRQASVQISMYDINLLLLPPPPPPPPLPPPLQLPSSFSPSHVSFTDQNFHTIPPQFPSLIDGSSVPIDRSMDQQTSSQTCMLQQNLFLPPQESIFPLPCRNMNELVLSQVPSFPQNLHILHAPLRSTLSMPGTSDQSLLQVTLFNPRPNLHFPIEPISPLSVRSMDEQTPSQVTVFHPNSCIPSNVVRLAVPLPAIRRMDDQIVSQVTLFHPNSFSTHHSLEPTLDVGNINKNAQVHFPFFDQHYLSPLPFQQFPPPNENLLSVMNEQLLQETSIDPYSGLNSMPFQSPLQEQVSHLFDTNGSDNHTIAQEDPFDANSSFDTTSPQQSPLKYLPPICSTDEEIPLQAGLFDQKSVFPPTSSQLTSTVLTIKSADGRETLQITTYDLYLLLLPPPPPPPYPPPSPPSTPTPPSSPTTDNSSEPTLLTTGINTSEDQLPSQPPSFVSSSADQWPSHLPSYVSISEDQFPSQPPSFDSNVHIPDSLPHFITPEQPTWPMAAMNNTAGGPFLHPPHPNSLHLSPELTSPMQAISSMNDCTPGQTLQIDPNSHFMLPSTFPIPSEPVYMPPVINQNQNMPSQIMPFYNPTWPPPTQPCPPPELLPVLNNTQHNVFRKPRIPNELSPPPSLVPLLEPRLPMLVVNTPEGFTLFWKPFRLPPPSHGPSVVAPLVNTGNCVLSPFPMSKLCTPPRHALPRLLGNMPGGLAAPPTPGFVPKLVCSPHQPSVTPARLIHLQARVPVYYSDEKNGTGSSTQNTKIILGA